MAKESPIKSSPPASGRVVSKGGATYHGFGNLRPGVKRMPSVVTIGNRPPPEPDDPEIEEDLE